MKKMYIFIAILLFSNFGYSQNNQRAIKFRAFEARMYSVDPPDSTNWEETDVLVVISFKDNDLNKINVYAKKSIQYDVVSFIKDYKDENKTLWSFYKCVNDNGEEVTIDWGLFDNPQSEHISTLRITNKNGFSFDYKLKKNE